MSDEHGSKPIPTNIADLDFSNIPTDIQSIFDDTTFPDTGSHDASHSLQSIAQDILEQGDSMSFNDILGNHHDPSMTTASLGTNGTTTIINSVESVNASSTMQSPASNSSPSNGNTRLPGTPNMLRNQASPPQATTSPSVMVKH